MQPERWEKIQELFHEAADLPEENRRFFLESNCAADTELMTQVLAMLDADAVPASILGRDLSDVAGSGITSDPHLPRHLFGAYHVTGMLGEGGMGVVYLAQRDDLGTRAALKIIRDAWLSPSRRVRFVL
jgi:serine/threonine-protein kinase